MTSSGLNQLSPNHREELYKESSINKVNQIDLPQQLIDLFRGRSVNNSGGVDDFRFAIEKNGVYVVSIENRESISGKGIRTKNKMAIFDTNTQKLYEYSPVTIRGADRDEIDDWGRHRKELKILDIKDGVVTIAKSSNDYFVVEDVDMDKGRVSTLYSSNLATKRKEKEKADLLEAMNKAESIEDMIKAQKGILSNKRYTVSDNVEKINDNIYIIVATDYYPGGDPQIRGKCFVIVQEGRKDVIEIYKTANVNERPSFSKSRGRVMFGEKKEVDNNIIIPVSIHYGLTKWPTYGSPTDKDLYTESFDIEIPKDKLLKKIDEIPDVNHIISEEDRQKHNNEISKSDGILAVANSILAKLKEMWKLKPEYMSDKLIRKGQNNSGYAPYALPKMTTSVFDKDSGYGAFVIREQIDARPNDPQYRYKLYLCDSKNPEKYIEVASEHEYLSAYGDLADQEGAPDLIKDLSIKDGFLYCTIRENKKSVKISS